MTGTGSHSGSGVGDAVRKGVGLVHGTGEAIRGNINAAVDTASGDHQSAARHQNIASRGVDEMEHGHYHGTGAGVTPADTGRERQNRVAQDEYGYDGSTNYGPHSSNVGNKVDPRYDSDMDHRGTTQGSTNYGPHSTNVGNKMDPRFDSDQDYRGARHGESTNYGPHSTNVANKLDPRYDSDLDHRGPGPYDEPTHRQHQPRHHSSIMNILDPRVDSGLVRRSSHEESLPRTPTYASPRRVDSAPNPALHIHHEHECPRDEEDMFEREYRDRHGSTTTTKTQHAPYSTRTANVLDSRVGAAAPKAEPHSTANPHNSEFLNLLDPRVDRNAAKQYQASDDNA